MASESNPPLHSQIKLEPKDNEEMDIGNEKEFIDSIEFVECKIEKQGDDEFGGDSDNNISFDVSTATKKSSKNTCHICNKTFKCIRSLTTHLFAHKGERPNECELCCWKFRHSDQLVNHLKRVHDCSLNSEGKYVLNNRIMCNECKIDLKKYNRQKKYLARFNIDSIINYRCLKCSCEFETLFEVNCNHWVQVIAKIKPNRKSRCSSESHPVNDVKKARNDRLDDLSNAGPSTQLNVQTDEADVQV